MLDRTLSFLITTSIFFFLGFGTLAYVAIFDPKSNEYLNLSVNFICKLFTFFG